MKLRIGLDFDNTIACYDHVFTHVANELGLIPDSLVLSKSEVKRIIHLHPGGDHNWQKLQGQIYGKYMHLASAFPGLHEFLRLAKLNGHEVFIVSHKSPFGHFDENRVPLRDEAMKWLVANKFVGTDSSMIPSQNVFFETTRREKIDKIKVIQCTHFVDDLQEVFDEKSFPPVISKYLFDPAGQGNFQNGQFEGSWRSISKELLGEWDEENIKAALNDLFHDLNILDVSIIKGRGNSRIYKLETLGQTNYVLKVYPDRQLDKRNRLETEFSACRLLNEAGLPVVNAVYQDPDMNWGIYSWVEGLGETADDQFVNRAIDFVKKLKILRASTSKDKFQDASESCLSGSEIVRQVRVRLDRLKGIDNILLQDFLNKEFVPVFESFIRVAIAEMREGFSRPIAESHQILSPSDFGSHNAIRNQAGETVFIDFEYFGWDDPVKLACDFYWHPAMNLAPDLKNKWVKELMAIFDGDKGFKTRFTYYLPLIGLRWCLILLNEFLPNKLAQRIHADQQKVGQMLTVQEIQLQKSKDILNILKTNTKSWMNVPSF